MVCFHDQLSPWSLQVSQFSPSPRWSRWTTQGNDTICHQIIWISSVFSLQIRGMKILFFPLLWYFKFRPSFLGWSYFFILCLRKMFILKKKTATYVEEDPSNGKDMRPLIPPQALCPITTISCTCEIICIVILFFELQISELTNYISIYYCQLKPRTDLWKSKGWNKSLWFHLQVQNSILYSRPSSWIFGLQHQKQLIKTDKAEAYESMKLI